MKEIEYSKSVLGEISVCISKTVLGDFFSSRSLLGAKTVQNGEPLGKLQIQQKKGLGTVDVQDTEERVKTDNTS
ncbi:hypothetical protein MAL04_20165 (plasmid) [Leptospira noguchii]|nr:hypothetical protein MAL04_20165 [Leptospira noguchii]